MGDMGADSLGHVFRFHSFGESHGRAVGIVLEGCPAGLPISLELLQKELNRRKPGQQAWASSRQEPDRAEILSGVFESKTLGTPIAVAVFNEDARSGDYEQIKNRPRQGHSEDLWREKFSHFDHRGGGRSSGRESLGRVMAGAFARMLIKELCPGWHVMAFVRQIASVKIFDSELKTAENLFASRLTADGFPARIPHKEKSQEALRLLEKGQSRGESFGSLVELWMEGLPKGLGQPLFHKFQADWARGVMSLGAVVGMETGRGLVSAETTGSVFHGSGQEQNYGGLRGGLTTGDRICFRVAFKPPSSFGETAKQGRHDPCIGPRAVPVLEALAGLVTADQLLLQRLDRIKNS